MLAHLFGSALAAAENGHLPDSLTRIGIRRLLKARSQSLTDPDVETTQEMIREFVHQCRNSPVALVPDLANEQHYEVPAEFFRRVLGKRLKYSCCDWSNGCRNLDQAEQQALSTTCERAEISEGMDILELGCGWGSLSLWMAEKYPTCNITAVSNSASQKDFIDSTARDAGLRNLNVVTADMNEFSTDQRFDRVVSIEMFEHMRNHEQLLQRVSSWLHPGGRLFVHLFCHYLQPYLFEARDESDWMARYFFSGGMMPSESLLLHYQSDLTLVDHWRWDGRHYERTCNEWLKLLDANHTDLEPVFAETYGPDHSDLWLNRWRMFFMACAELFGYRSGKEWFVAHYLFSKR